MLFVIRRVILQFLFKNIIFIINLILYSTILYLFEIKNLAIYMWEIRWIIIFNTLIILMIFNICLLYICNHLEYFILSANVILCIFCLIKYMYLFIIMMICIYCCAFFAHQNWRAFWWFTGWWIVICRKTTFIFRWWRWAATVCWISAWCRKTYSCIEMTKSMDRK